jgi:hypothetical protein
MLRLKYRPGAHVEARRVRCARRFLRVSLRAFNEAGYIPRVFNADLLEERPPGGVDSRSIQRFPIGRNHQGVLFTLHVYQLRAQSHLGFQHGHADQ